MLCTFQSNKTAYLKEWSREFLTIYRQYSMAEPIRNWKYMANLKIFRHLTWKHYKLNKYENDNILYFLKLEVLKMARSAYLMETLRISVKILLECFIINIFKVSHYFWCVGFSWLPRCPIMFSLALTFMDYHGSLWSWLPSWELSHLQFSPGELFLL